MTYLSIQPASGPINQRNHCQVRISIRKGRKRKSLLFSLHKERLYRGGVTALDLFTEVSTRRSKGVRLS